ncbi:MAG: hydroxymethylglutaryl-CoA reductase [Saprospiraceae bacterium]|nr:hydroxymethylglutaryl-CoA reductase [Saprospiraceae bacterium]MBK8297945.1 hydroxymethylglutaryl-CoA reductase [Saprospiraceae bacterium]
MVEHFFKDPENVMHELMSYWHHNEDQQKILDGFSENTITNFPLPYSVAPNFLINGKTYCVPLVTEESSVVAAAASAAKFWMDRGGFYAEVLNTKKLGQIHFKWKGTAEQLKQFLPDIQELMLANAKDVTQNMFQRGGGVESFELKQLDGIPNYFQLLIGFQTCDSMGANFINSCLESFSSSLENYFLNKVSLPDDLRDAEIIMSILSNYTPECLVRAWVQCPISELGEFAGNLKAAEFAERFYTAVQIAKEDPYRAVTHNKGIFNGIDAVVLATANDFRAVEACGHAYAARNGSYSSLSDCRLEDGMFYFSLELPIALGTVGGLTALHPMAKRSLELLENPSAESLMMITAATGLAQNFAAVRSLITTGIQYGHMKMHLVNILHHFKANEQQIEAAKIYFSKNKVSFHDVRSFLEMWKGDSL